MRHRQVGERGDAGQQQFRQRHPDTVRHRLCVRSEDRQVFVERGIIEARTADLIDQALVQRLAGWVGMDVHQPRHDHQALAVDDDIGGAVIVAADEADRSAGEGEVGVRHIGVCLTVPADDHPGVPNKRRGHRIASSILVASAAHTGRPVASLSRTGRVTPEAVSRLHRSGAWSVRAPLPAAPLGADSRRSHPTFLGFRGTLSRERHDKIRDRAVLQHASHGISRLQHQGLQTAFPNIDAIRAGAIPGSARTERQGQWAIHDGNDIGDGNLRAI